VKDPPENIVRRNVWPLVAAYVPRALIADRTALENRPASDGSVFLVSEHNRNIVLPGLILRSRKGPAPLASDRPFISNLRIASTARAFLENVRPSRARHGLARTLTKTELEERLDEMVRLGGEAALQRIRTEARAISQELAMEAEFRALDRSIGALLGSRKAALESPLAIARAAGMPYDPHRLDLFQQLYSALASSAPVTRPAKPADGPALPRPHSQNPA
jgi:hypothetical protein